MAIIKCRECGQTVSTEAQACPHCGAPQRAVPPHVPPTVIVQQVPEKKKGMGILGWGCLFLFLVPALFMAVGIAVVGPSNLNPGSTRNRKLDVLDPKDVAREFIGIADWTWNKTGFGNIMEASFTITNGSTFDIKDIKIRCVHSAKSGTKIDRNTKTIYEVIKAGETKRLEKVNMGFIHDQAASSGASIVDFEIVK